MDSTLSPGALRALAREAYVFGFPVVDNYRIHHATFIDPRSPGFKAPWNTLHHDGRLYTAEDTTVQAPNSDTLYSQLGLDLRAEPWVLSVPEVPAGRYYSIQLIDAYTHIIGYVGTRATGNGAGHYLVAGPGWTGEVPPGIDGVLRSETPFVGCVYRTQLFSPSDMAACRATQAGQRARPLSAFLGVTAPPAAPSLDFPRPLTRQAQRDDPRFFSLLNFALSHGPTHPSEQALMQRLAAMDVGGDRVFDADALTPAQREAIGLGIADAWTDFDALSHRIHAGEVISAQYFGSREHLQNNYLYRFAAAVIGIYGNAVAESISLRYGQDADGRAFHGAERYTLRFAPGQLPPADAFWSLTLYRLPEMLLAANPLDRYLLNAPMLPQFVRDADGGITFDIQARSPGAAREANWLPAPEGPFVLLLRLYLPRPEALDGRWKKPPVIRVA